MLIRRLARPMLASIFIMGGIGALKDTPNHAKGVAPMLEKAIDPVRDSLPEQVPTDTETLVRIDAGVKIGAGALLALGKFPRLASLLLAGSIVPTTLAAHRFWEQDDPQQRAEQQIHFLKNLGLLGGVLLAAVDTGGKPSVGYRARKSARIAKKTAKTANKTAGKKAKKSKK
ncbi:DoxX family protein [Saccharopolyspora dendranthemae]|uniref:Putative membrane protein YphA (DoxX/SURF4 family) n=1 Tax=Saccharopolyspora dendranthemae TaxID=1181886 RepID=A0A561U547_9PSEU|nr:DoxX family protein [Saccharopolyspora dendranthemae]TWF94484.1 putative membrane protein YphA (DoxX/SURF4 family) [Saccharopolyspora dendranthemae]